MPLILAVDGGGSKTEAVIVNEKGERLGRGLAGCGNHQMIGMPSALENIRKSIADAFEESGLTYEHIDFAQYGLAGADRDSDFSIIHPALESLPFKNWDVVCDTMEGLRIGSPNYYGVVLICGNGTNAAGRNNEGRVMQTGGFGYLYGDKSGGAELARETFRAAVRSWEKREKESILVKLVCEYFRYDDMEKLWNDFLDRGVSHIPAGLTLVLHDAAKRGDELANSILSDTGEELGLAAQSVINRLKGFEQQPIPLVLVGSVLQKGKSPALLQALVDTVKKSGHEVELIIPKIAPVYGAVLLAFDQLNIKVTNAIYMKLESYGGEKH